MVAKIWGSKTIAGVEFIAFYEMHYGPASDLFVGALRPKNHLVSLEVTEFLASIHLRSEQILGTAP